MITCTKQTEMHWQLRIPLTDTESVSFEVEVEGDSWYVSIVNLATNSVSKDAIDQLVDYAQSYRVQQLYIQLVMHQFFETSTEVQDLFKKSWSVELHQHVFLLDAKAVNALPIFKKIALSEEFHVHPVSDLQPHEVQAIQEGEEVWYPKRHHPLQYEQFAKNSLILRYQDELIGWCMVVQANHEILLYDNLYVTPPYWHLASSLFLMHKAVAIQCEQSSIRYMTFVVDDSNKGLLRVLRKRGKECLVDYQEIRLYKLI